MPTLTPAAVPRDLDIDVASTRAPSCRCSHHLFGEQVQRTPNAIAVAFQDQELTYSVLDRRANALAHRLCDLGVGPDVLVGICVERSLEMTIGLLGILKAGGAYVPLDPTYPKDRLAFMLEDSRVPIVLTQSWLQDRLPGQEQTLVICLDWLWNNGCEESPNTPASNIRLTNLAYVIYTSGSTGRPKGVAMPHGPLVNLLTWQQGPDVLPAAARTLQFTSLSFDVSFQEIFSTLCTGGTLVLISNEMRRDPAALLSYLAEHAIERLFLPFVALQRLAEAAVISRRFPQALRDIITAGEQLQISRSLVQMFEQLPDCRLHNHYGPTESHVVTAYILQGRPQEWPTLPPIGTPIANTRLLLLDADFKPAPVGAAAELYIGGICLAQGYLNRPDLTAERFIADPFADAPGTRLYKTGDLVRQRRDGNYEYLGRTDDQVKIRGFRIELGEIEAALREHPAVMESAVLAREDIPGDKRLVAYVVLHKDQQLREETARDFLRQRLPEYMAPATIVFLPAMPLTSSGKVDRRGLAAPPLRKLVANQPGESPRNTLELQLTVMVEEVLHTRPVGIHDDFFALGGDSLQAADLVTRIFKRLHRRLPLATLLQAPTVAKLAQILSADGTTPSWSCLVPIQPEGSQRPFFCVHPMGGNILIYRALPRHLGPEQPVYAFQAKGLDGKDRPYTQVQEMAAHYIAEMQSLQPKGPYRLGGLSFGGVIAFEMAQQLCAAGQQVSLLVLFDTAKPGSIQPGVMRLPAHFQHFLALGLRDKLKFIREQTGPLVARARWTLWRLVFHLCQLSGFRLPTFLWDVSRLNDEAERSYVLRPYPGRAVLFRAKEQLIGTHADPLLGWAPYVTGGLEVHEISGNHAGIVEEPHVQALADILHRCLQEDAANEMT